MRVLDETDTATTTTADAADAAAGAEGKAADAAAADSKTGDAGAGKGQGEAGKEGDQGKDAGKEEGDGADDQPVVPEAYTAPEGVALSAPLMEFYSELAKGAGMSQEQFAQSATQAEAMRARLFEFERGELRVQSEEEFGKDFEGIANGAQRALVELEKERPGITDRLDKTNLGNHPDFLWAFNKIGSLLKPKKVDGADTESAAAPPQRPVEDRLYGKKP